MPGMRVAINGPVGDVIWAIVCFVDANHCLVLADERGSDHGWYRMTPGPVGDRCRPDLEDPATLGSLLALVREAHGDPATYCCDYQGYDALRWVVHGGDGEAQVLGEGATEAEALVAALEAAGARRPERES